MCLALCVRARFWPSLNAEYTNTDGLRCTCVCVCGSVTVTPSQPYRPIIDRVFCSIFSLHRFVFNQAKVSFQKLFIPYWVCIRWRRRAWRQMEILDAANFPFPFLSSSPSHRAWSNGWLCDTAMPTAIAQTMGQHHPNKRATGKVALSSGPSVCVGSTAQTK